MRDELERLLRNDLLCAALVAILLLTTAVCCCGHRTDIEIRIGDAPKEAGGDP